MGAPLREVYGKTLQKLSENPRVVVLDSDLGSATKSIEFKKICPKRYIDVGIAEQNMVGIAAGLSTCGMIPIASSFSVFVTGRAFDQVRNTVAYAKLNVKLVGTHAGVTVGYDGATHEAVEDIAIMRAIPNMTVLCPCDAKETELALQAAVAYEGPVYLRISRVGTPDVHKDGYAFAIGKGEILRDGKDAAVIATGIMVGKALEAAEKLAAQGKSVMVVNMPSIKPIDRALIVEAAKKTGRIVTAEEHNVFGGLGSAVSEVLAEEYPVKMKFVGIKDKFGTSGDPDELLKVYHLTADDIALAVHALE